MLWYYLLPILLVTWIMLIIIMMIIWKFQGFDKSYGLREIIEGNLKGSAQSTYDTESCGQLKKMRTSFDGTMTFCADDGEIGAGEWFETIEADIWKKREKEPSK